MPVRHLTSAPAAAVAAPAAVPGSAGELFLTFAAISLQSFGGALAIIERTVVVRKRWLDAKEFVGVFAIAQVLPGPTGIAFCVLLGDRFCGWRGAAAALAGFLLPPAAVVLGVTALFQQFQHVPQVQGALHGMGAAAVGLIVTTAARMARTLRGEHVGIAVALASFAMVGLAGMPVSSVVLTLGVLSVALAWRKVAR
ncbi:MAG: chromate transporter [Caldimonas sp.]